MELQEELATSKRAEPQNVLVFPYSNPMYMQESSLSITDFLRTAIHLQTLPRKGHLAADDDQRADFPGVAEVEDVDDAKEDLKDDGRRSGDEVHRLSPKVVDVLCNQKRGNKPETLESSLTIKCL